MNFILHITCFAFYLFAILKDSMLSLAHVYINLNSAHFKVGSLCESYNLQRLIEFLWYCTYVNSNYFYVNYVCIIFLVNCNKWLGVTLWRIDLVVILSNLFLNLVKFSCELGQVITRSDTLKVGRVISKQPIVSNLISGRLLLFTSLLNYILVWFWFYWMFYDHFSAHSLLAKLGRWGWWWGWGWLARKQDYIEIRPEAPGVWTKNLINLIPMYCHHFGTADSEKYRCVKPEGT